MTNNVTDEIRREHAALLWALSLLDDDVRFRNEVYRGLAGRGPAAWHAMLMRAAEAIADTIPRQSAERAEAAADVRGQLERLTARHGALLTANDDDADLDHLDGPIRALLDDEGGAP